MWKILNLIAETINPVRKMEITRSNFKDRLPSVEAAIDSAIFLAVDGEFTGLNAYRGISPFDLPHERYDKLQESARQFLLVQFGLCTFHYDKETQQYSNQAFNFYVWPRPYSRQAPDPRFLCQTSSIDFLIQQGFDFNKLYKEGVSYLRPAEVDKLRSSLLERQGTRRLNLTPGGEQRDIAIPPDQSEFLDNVHQQIRGFLSAPDQQSLDLPKCNSFQRRLIYQTVREKFSDVSLTTVVKTGGDRVIAVVKADQDEQERLAGEKDRAEMNDLEEAFGFSRVIRKMTESGKMVVGHNMILDVAHTLNQFCGPLPERYDDFKAMTREVFPSLLDTKLMANTIPFKDEIPNSSLEALFETVSASPYKMPDCGPKFSGYGYQRSSNKYHEAGYDAFITGLCFIAMSNRLGSLCGSKVFPVLPNHNLVKPFVNKLYLVRIADIPYMNLAGEDIKPDRSRLLHIEFPPEWKRSDLNLLFSPFGKVFISWINDTSAFVSLPETTDISNILDVIQSSSLYKVVTYKRYQELKESAVANPPEAATPQTRFHATPKLPPPTSLSLTPGQASCGITPTMARSNLSFGNGGSGDVGAVKRSMSPDVVAVKRSKSVAEDKEVDKEKLFDEPKWD